MTCTSLDKTATSSAQLDEIYGSFSEGFDTPDLVRAKARLENA